MTLPSSHLPCQLQHSWSISQSLVEHKFHFSEAQWYEPPHGHQPLYLHVITTLTNLTIINVTFNILSKNASTDCTTSKKNCFSSTHLTLVVSTSTPGGLYHCRSHSVELYANNSKIKQETMIRCRILQSVTDNQRLHGQQKAINHINMCVGYTSQTYGLLHLPHHWLCIQCRLT